MMKEVVISNIQDGSPHRGGDAQRAEGVTLFDKIWNAHIVQQVQDGPTQLYIDRLYCHEVTTPQAFDTLRDKNPRIGGYVSAEQYLRWP